MSKILALFKRDLSNVTKNVIALVCCFGMAVIPSLYAWFNIAGAWDPYGNTQNLKVAVANEDTGFSTNVLPLSINVGDSVVNKLHENDEIGWTFVSEDEAIEGVKSGAYYAAIIIPQDFSESLLTFVNTGDAKQAELVYYDNEKENSIASIVTNKASSAVKQQIDETFAKTISEVAASAMQSISNYLTDDTMVEVGTNVETSVTTALQGLDSVQDTLSAYRTLIASCQALLDGSQELLSQTSTQVTSLTSSLVTTATTVKTGASSLKTALNQANTTVHEGLDWLDEVESTVQGALENASSKPQLAATGLDDAAAVLDRRASSLEGVADKLASQQDSIDQQLDALQNASAENAAQPALIKALNSLSSTTTRAHNNVAAAAKTLRETQDVLTQKRDELNQGVSDATTTAQEAQGRLDAAEAALRQASDVSTEELDAQLTNLSNKLTTVAQQTTAIGTQAQEHLSSLAQLAQTTADDLGTMDSALAIAQQNVSDVREELTSLNQALQDALVSHDMTTLKTLLASSPTDLASYLSSPVSLQKEAVYPVANNGSAMAPYFTTLALWVGAIVLVVLLRSNPTKEELATLPTMRPGQIYLGRQGIFLLFGCLQGLLVGTGDLIFLQIQCEEPLLFVLACVWTGFVDTCVVYSLDAAFGDIGKAIAIFMLVLQVAGSGGTFPVQMLPQAFQTIYPYLPFVWSMTAMRECIGGLYANTYVLALARLACFIVPTLVIGLVIRPFSMRANAWIERQLHATKVM